MPLHNVILTQNGEEVDATDFIAMSFGWTKSLGSPALTFDLSRPHHLLNSGRILECRWSRYFNAHRFSYYLAAF